MYRLTILRDIIITIVLLLGASGMSGCSSPADKANKFYEHGLRLLEKGELAKANIEFRNALQIDPTITKAIWGQVQVAEKQGKLSELYKLLNAVLVNEPEDLQAHIKLGRLLLIAGKLDESLEMSEKAMRINNQDLGVLSLRATLFLKLDNKKGAVGLANKIITQDPNHVDALIVLATERLMEKDAEKALGYLEQGLKNDDKNVPLQLIKIKALKILSKFDEVENVYRRLIDYYPKVSGFNYGLAQFYLQHDKKNDAEKEYRAVIKKFPTELKYKLNLVKFISKNKGLEEGVKQLEIFSQQDPGNYELKFELVHFYISRNDISPAKKILTSIIDNPVDIETTLKAKAMMAGILLGNGKNEAAQNIIGEILGKDKENENALILKASIDIDNRDYDDAIAGLRLVLRGNPTSSRALFLLGKTYNLSGSPELADEHFYKAFKASHFNKKYGLGYANFLLKRKQYKQAEKIILEVLNTSRDSLEAMKLLAKTRLLLGDWVGAQQVADAIKRGAGASIVGEQIENEILLSQKNYSESITLLKEMYQSAPDKTLPIVSLVRTYLLSGKTDEAGNFLDAVINANPLNINARLLRGQVYLAQGKIEQAIEIYNGVVKQDPANTKAHYQLARVYILENEYDKANEVLGKGLSVSPKNFALGLTLASLHVKMGKIDKAIKHYEKLLVVRPDSDIVANNLASLLTEYRTDKASLNKAYTISKRFKSSSVPHFKDTFAWACYRIGKYPDASILLENAIEQLPTIPDFHYHLGMVYLAMDNKEMARKEFEKTLELVGDKRFAKSTDIRDILNKL